MGPCPAMHACLCMWVPAARYKGGKLSGVPSLNKPHSSDEKASQKLNKGLSRWGLKRLSSRNSQQKWERENLSNRFSWSVVKNKHNGEYAPVPRHYKQEWCVVFCSIFQSSKSFNRHILFLFTSYKVTSVNSCGNKEDKAKEPEHRRG